VHDCTVVGMQRACCTGCSGRAAKQRILSALAAGINTKITPASLVQYSSVPTHNVTPFIKLYSTLVYPCCLTVH
jgi:hypothetical protein